MVFGIELEVIRSEFYTFREIRQDSELSSHIFESRMMLSLHCKSSIKLFDPRINVILEHIPVFGIYFMTFHN